MGVFVGAGGGGRNTMRIDNVKLPIGESENEVFEICLKRSRLKRSAVKYFKILKKSIDARDKRDVKFVYSAEISDKEIKIAPLSLPHCRGGKTVVVGFGPAGMFCALYLARAGYKPIVVERGESVDDREKSVYKFVNERILNENSNIQFGEGGAGAFSDGKLSSGVSGEFTRTVLSDFVSFGAPKEIEWEAKPHIGSDLLPSVVKNLRKEIERLGGSVRFSTRLTGIKTVGGKIAAAITDAGEIECDRLVLAIGHSARDTYKAMLAAGATIEPKPFAVGFRIEHLQRDISLAQYGEKFAPLLPAADYRLASRKGERGVFTFCMCPGGYVLPSSSEEGGVVTNGMSLYSRSGENANSAVLCEVYPSDFPVGALGGAEMQREIEKKAFMLGGGNYCAPVQTVKDFFDGVKTAALKSVKPTYPIGYELTDLNGVYIKSVTENLKSGIRDMGEKLKGFSSDDAVLTGVETRSSSPVRILRGENYESISIENLYPCGEGCGYAGGIMSAAIDGIKVAAAIAKKENERSYNI